MPNRIVPPHVRGGQYGQGFRSNAAAAAAASARTAAVCAHAAEEAERVLTSLSRQPAKDSGNDSA